MCGASRCAARCANSRTRRVSSRKTRTTQCSTRREARRVVERDDSEELIFFRATQRDCRPRLASRRVSNARTNRTNRTDDRWMDSSPFERFLESSLGRRVVVERVARSLTDLDLLFVSMTSRALRECVVSLRGEDGYRALRTPRLFPDARRVDPTTTIDPCDPCERLWTRIASGAFARWGLTIDTTTMVETIRNPPRGRGDAEVQLRVQYLRNRLRCPWDARVCAYAYSYLYA